MRPFLGYGRSQKVVIFEWLGLQSGEGDAFFSAPAMFALGIYSSSVAWDYARITSWENGNSKKKAVLSGHPGKSTPRS